MDDPEHFRQSWLDTALRLSPRSPDWLDETCFAPQDGTRAAQAGGSDGPWLAAHLSPGAGLEAPSGRLFPLRDAQMACIGLRLRQRPERPEQLAAHLVGMALERGVETIVLSHLAHCGLERFGLRIERIGAASEAECARQEEELKRFWNIALVIEAEQILSLG